MRGAHPLAARAVLYVEAVTGFLAGCWALVHPASFALQFGTGIRAPVGIELARWYGSVTMVATALLFAALRSKEPAFLKPLLWIFLVGDFVQILVAFPLAEAAHRWTPTSTAAVALSLLYAGARIVYLRRLSAPPAPRS